MTAAAALDVLGCPACKGALTENTAGQFLCATHGMVARRRFNAIDFLFDRDVLRSAAGGTFDLKEDEARAAELATRIPHQTCVR
jgi:hypothetical protein